MGNVRSHYAAGLMLGLMLVTGPVCAQDFGGREAGGTAYFTFARPGQNTIEVLVLGGNSGIYRIGEDINLGQLVALAGGGGRGGRRIKARVYLFRMENGERRKVLEEGINDFVERPQYPSLEEGDVVRIETRERLNWRDALSITSTVLSLSLTILTVFDVGL